jgi:hypothetical protein
MLEKLTKILDIGGVGLTATGTGEFKGELFNTGSGEMNITSPGARFYLDVPELDGKEVEFKIATTINGTDHILAKFKKVKNTPYVETLEISNCPIHIRALIKSNNVTWLKAAVYCSRF